MTLYVGIGQCGVQVLCPFLQQCLSVSVPNPFLDRNEKIRAILVDGEPKVIRWAQSQSQSGQWIGGFRPECLISDQEGRGNNWALGYVDPLAGDGGLMERTMGAVRKQMERMDVCMGVIMFHSTAGGTGAGLGSRVIEWLADEYSKEAKLTVSVLPSTISSDTCLQSYNSCLTLAKLLLADASFHFCNDDLFQMQSHQHGGIEQEQANEYISQTMFSLFSPWKKSSYVSILKNRILLSVFNPFELLVKLNGHRFLQASFHSEIPDKLIKQGFFHLFNRIDPKKAFSKKMSTIHQTDLIFLKHHGSTLVRPSSGVVIRELLKRAKAMFLNKAYLHWYTRYGLEEEDFVSSFELIEIQLEIMRHEVKV